MTSCRKFILLIGLAGIGCLQAQVQSSPLNVERQGNHLVVTAPQLHFLEGKPLEQLHNGASVTYVVSLTLSAAGAPSYRVRGRFILSYDLWEEKFSVVQAEPPGRSASHLTAAAAESWCLENLPVSVPALRSDKSFSIKLECSVEQSETADSGSGLTLAALIDVFSRKSHEELPHWEALSGPLRLADLKEKKK